jgi:F0F1-type ATP synthase assembly protein I
MYCQGPCYHSGRDQEGHRNLGQRECWLLAITLVQEAHLVIEQQVIVSAAYMHGEFRKWSVEYSRSGTAMTLAPRPFPIFTATLCLCIRQPFSSNKVQYLADGEVGKITWFQETMAQLDHRHKDVRPFNMSILICHVWDCIASPV